MRFFIKIVLSAVFLLPVLLIAQKSMITGTVIDSLAEKPLSGATIVLKSQEGD